MSWFLPINPLPRPVAALLHTGKLDFSYYSSVMGDATAVHSSSNSNSNSSGNNSSSNSGTSLPPSPSPELLKLTSFASLLFAAAATVLGI